MPRTVLASRHRAMYLSVLLLCIRRLLRICPLGTRMGGGARLFSASVITTSSIKHRQESAGRYLERAHCGPAGALGPLCDQGAGFVFPANVLLGLGCSRPHLPPGDRVTLPRSGRRRSFPALLPGSCFRIMLVQLATVVDVDPVLRLVTHSCPRGGRCDPRSRRWAACADNWIRGQDTGCRVPTDCGGAGRE